MSPTHKGVWEYKHPTYGWGCLAIMNESNEEVETYFVLPLGEGVYELSKLVTGKGAVSRYRLKIGDSCECPWYKYHKTCKHLQAMGDALK